MLKNKRIFIIILASILALAVVITIVVFALTTGKKEQQEITDTQENIDTAKLEMKFKQEFSSEETDYVKHFREINESKVGKYDVQAYLPKLEFQGEEAEKINNEIYKLAANILNQALKTQKYAKYNMEYESFLNDDILSLVIRFTVKDGENPRRIIIKTYNYDIKKNKQVKLDDIADNEQKDEIQKKIETKIEEANKFANQSIEKGYKAYIRDPEKDIYKIKNATEFFIGENKILYIVYAYGNQEYTDEIDLIMHKL